MTVCFGRLCSYVVEKNQVSEIFSRFIHVEWAKRVALLLLDIEKDPTQMEIVEEMLANLADMIRSGMAPRLKLVE